MHLFVALDIPDVIRQSITAYVDDLRRIAPDAKWVRPESYHVTLKFIGEWKKDVREVIDTLQKVEVVPINIHMCGCGFFPNPRSPRVFWTGIESEFPGEDTPGHNHRSAECGDGLPSPSSQTLRTPLFFLAHMVDEACASLGIAKEDRPFSPHLTLARSGSGSPRPRKDERSVPSMKRLAERIAGLPAPDFGTIHAKEYFLYESKLSPSGAKYTKLKSFALRASE